jgi:hypothetical protein
MRQRPCGLEVHVTHSSRYAAVLLVIALACALYSSTTWAANPFVDIAGNGHADNIDAIFNAGITLGCSDTSHYCPSDFVRRDQMASFMARLAGLSSGATKNFLRVNGRSEVQSYCALAAASPFTYDNVRCRRRLVVVDSNGQTNTGMRPTVAIGVDRLPVVAYESVSDGKIKIVHCEDLWCSKNTSSQVGGQGSASQPSIAVGAESTPIIAYISNSTKVMLGRCGDPGCGTGASPSEIDSLLATPGPPRLAIASNDATALVFKDNASGSLFGWFCETSGCNPRSRQTIASSITGSAVDVRFGADNLAVVTYADAGTGRLVVAHCLDTLCTSHSTSFPDQVDNSGLTSAIAIAPDGRPVIAHADSDSVRITRCADALCASGTTVDLGEGDDHFYPPAIAFSTSGNPIVAYTHGFLVRFVTCKSLTCSESTTQTLEEYAASPTIALGTDGIAVVPLWQTDVQDFAVTRPSA